MSIPPYPEASSRPPIKYVWPKRIAVIATGLALVGGIGVGVNTLLSKDDTASTSQETTASPAPAPSQAPAPAPETPQAPTGSSQAPQAPMALRQAVTDAAGALSSEQLAEVKSAVKSLQTAREVRLWVVYVDAFDVPPGEWAQKTISLTKMGDRDAILAVATTQRKYAFLVAPAAANLSDQAINAMRINDIEPKLHDNDFAGAAVAAANGLQALG